MNNKTRGPKWTSFFWTKRPLKKEKKKDKIMVEKEQIFYKSQVVLVRKLANLTQT